MNMNGMCQLIVLCYAMACCSCQNETPSAGRLLLKPQTTAPITPVSPWENHQTPKEKEAERNEVKKIAASAHPVKIYFHSEHGPDDGSWSWVIGRYDGPKHFLGTVAPTLFAELLSAEEDPTDVSNDCWVNMEAVTDEGTTFSFSIYMESNEDPRISSPNVIAPHFWKQIAELINSKYDLPARARKADME